MWIELIAMIVAGIAVAGIVLMLRRLTRERLPRWTVPAAIGVGMIAFSIWNEYSWYPRVTSVLPEGVTIISAPAESQPWRPWTYLVPLHTRFVAFDGTAKAQVEGNPALRRGEVMVVVRWAGTKRFGMAFDCAGGLQADLVDGAGMAADGSLTGGASWRQAAPDDPLQTVACQRG